MRKVGVVGLGYVGLPVALAFAKAGALAVGYDIDVGRVEELQRYFDRTLESSEADLRSVNMPVSADPADLKAADFFIVTVPTPIDAANQPDMSIVFAASRTVGKALKKGDIVVYESTVYPGATEEDCVPILERESGLKCGVDFHVGYSPERINPGDHQHRFESIVKVVSGQDAATLDVVAQVYGAVVTAGIHRAPSIKVAEAAKVIENTQRDLNIALINELALIFRLLDIDTSDVLAAARTKWNFLGFTPGLVGGHCIGVDPYYLTHRAERAGYHPQVILAGRRVNDQMGAWVARECIKYLLAGGSGKTVVILGVTFKENVPDIRNSKVAGIVSELRSFGVDVHVADPLAKPAECEHEYEIRLTPIKDLPPADAVILAVSHEEYKHGGWPLLLERLKGGKGLVMDIKAVLDRAGVPAGVKLWRM
ncbi:nucleotide sugar dehydrogenase [Bradyrhizobium erythrophlei]|uniref:nucleotide sugar dehydrogenase n=1 Tax=Bradyrhizobium erythrophlei TaxID=1437360 RepID=UPI0035F02446